ncbi:hypothetical protein [Reinekea thalattae]|uniref:Uncharacterized protein n=1 Tax=Reinekea thalattae TaxID=2593301 RepID=A0A5C8Z9D3_9GAMM|nr:hypothetical protein [Reinekea thalattae]TXR53466.1 hypothetical protein FME95_02540 [Reinekea thalattae]
MRKLVLFVIAIVATSGIFVWFFSSASSTTADDTLSFVPADTAYYVGGKPSKDAAKYINNYPLAALSPVHSELWRSSFFPEVDPSLLEEASPKAKFFYYFLNEYNSLSDRDITKLAKLTGLSPDDPFALFSDGLMPVLRLGINNASTLNTLIENAVQNSQWQYTQDNIDDMTVRLWPLNGEYNRRQAFFTIANNENYAVFTIITNDDDLDAKKQRLGIIKPEQSLANDRDTQSLRKQYDGADNLFGMIQLNHIARALITPETNKLGRDLERYLFLKEVTAECSGDLIDLADSMPRLVMGYDSITIDSGEAQFNSHTTLQMNNAALPKQLKKIQGHIPEHSTEVKDKILAAGIGINIDNLMPVLSTLLEQFAAQDFNCPALIKAQTNSFNLEKLTSFVELLNGVKGIGFSIFDITESDQKITLDEYLDYIELEHPKLPESADFIVSVATENPESLFSFLATAAGLKISDNVKITHDDIPFLPKTMTLTAAIKGSHLVLFSGEKSEDVAEKLINETTKTNGLFSVNSDLVKIRQLITFDSFNRIASYSSDNCVAAHAIANQLQDYPATISMTSKIDNKGLVIENLVNLETPDQKNLNLVGEYKLNMLSRGCRWVELGNYRLNSDGTDNYTLSSADSSCDLTVSNGTWKIEGNMLITSNDMQHRKFCTDEFAELQHFSAPCHIMNVHENGFECAIGPSAEYRAIYKYNRL